MFGHSTVLYFLVVKNCIVANDNKFVDNSHNTVSKPFFFKRWLNSNYIWAPGRDDLIGPSAEYAIGKERDR